MLTSFHLPLFRSPKSPINHSMPLVDNADTPAHSNVLTTPIGSAVTSPFSELGAASNSQVPKAVENPSQSDDLDDAATHIHLTATPSPSKPVDNSPASNSQMAQVSETHPNRKKWPEWLMEAVKQLEIMIGSSQWRFVLNGWLDIEDVLGYPEGKVS